MVDEPIGCFCLAALVAVLPIRRFEDGVRGGRDVAALALDVRTGDLTVVVRLLDAAMAGVLA